MHARGLEVACSICSYFPAALEIRLSRLRTQKAASGKNENGWFRSHRQNFERGVRCDVRAYVCRRLSKTSSDKTCAGFALKANLEGRCSVNEETRKMSYALRHCTYTCMRVQCNMHARDRIHEWLKGYVCLRDSQ